MQKILLFGVYNIRKNLNYKNELTNLELLVIQKECDLSGSRARKERTCKICQFTTQTIKHCAMTSILPHLTLKLLLRNNIT